MILKVSVPSRFQFKTRPNFRTMFLQREGEIHYIGGADILPAPLDGEAEQELIGKLGGPEEKEARSRLIEHNLRLVVYIAKKFDNTAVGVEDLISIGTIGLIKAINTFNIDKGSRLATYAAKCVENEILMLLRAGKKYSKEVSLFEPIGVDKDGETVSLVDVIEMENKETIEDLIFEQDVKDLYMSYEKCLKDTEKTVVGMRYGLYGKKEHTQREIAEKLGISRSYVSRIEKKALEKMRREMEAPG